MSIEKAFKGLYQKILNEIPPKTHNFVFLMNKISLKPPENIGRFLVILDEANVAIRYPEELNQLQLIYTQSIVKDILSRSKEVLEWIKTQF